MVWLIGFGLNCSWGIVGKQKNFWVNKGIPKSCIFKRWNVVNGSSEVRNPQYFLKGPNKTLQMHLNILPKLELIFCCIQQKVHKISHFWYLNDHNSGSKHNEWPRFSYLVFEFQKLNFSSVKYPLFSKFCSVKYTLPH